jgi:WD40 repeat protein
VVEGTYGFEAHTLFIYDAADHKELHRIQAPCGFWGLVYSPDSKTILGCGSGALAVLYDASTGRELHRFTGSTVLRAPCFSPDGKLLAIHDIHKTTITFWNVESGEEVTTWDQTPGVNSIAFDPNDERLAVGNEEGHVVLRQVTSGNVLRVLVGHGGRVQQVGFTPDGKTIISSSDDGTIRLWNPESSRAREVIPVGPTGYPLRFNMDPSGCYLFAYGVSPLVYILRIDG